MNIQKENICMNKVKTKNIYQITLDNDYIVSDVKPDINKIIREQGEVLIDEYKIHKDKIEVKGRVRVVVLYLSDDEEMMINSVIQYMQFYENINMPGIDVGDSIYIKGALEDITINIINSRKISVKVLVNLNSIVDEEISYDTVIDVLDDNMIQKRNKQLNITKLVINKKDIYRIKDEIVLQSSKKNINEILYYNVHMPRCNTRVGDEKITLKGDILVFILYLTEEGEYECLEKEIPYNGEVDLYEAKEHMIDDIYVNIMENDITVNPDDDGERRVIDIDVTLNLDIKCYQDEVKDILEDAYALDCDMKLDEEEITYETLLLKNNTTFKVEDEIKILDNDILQVCNSTSSVKIDEMNIVEDGIDIEGVVEVNIIYISNKDSCPINSIKQLIPFNHRIEVNGIDKDSVFNIKPYVEQVGVIMVSSDIMDVMISINIDTIIFRKNKEVIVSNIKEEILDKGINDKVASMIGYIVKEGDDLWSVGKKFHTTVDMLKKVNQNVDSSLKKGDKLLIVKSCHRA